VLFEQKGGEGMSKSPGTVLTPDILSAEDTRVMKEMDSSNINCEAIRRFKGIHRLNLVNFDTPIEKCDRLRASVPGCPHLYIKRDDYTGFLVGGNKLRKMEYLMVDVLEKKATTMITVGSVQSNHARVMAMVARRFGLKAVLILNGKLSKRPSGNFRINSLLGAKIHSVVTRAQRDAAMDEIAETLEKKGERVYKVPLGASDEIGSFGMVAAFEEIQTYAKRTGIQFDAIVVATSSGGTQTGLEVGKRLFNWNRLRIYGISPDDPSERIKDSILATMKPMLSRLGLDSRVGKNDLHVDGSFIGAGYGIPSPQSRKAAGVFLDTEGIFLDPVYTSKAAAALLEYCRKRKFSSEDRILFWHTGGLLALFK
jgi:D-cysteine desulfhydrase family pyridoxal phosphate-dependent enzyme